MWNNMRGAVRDRVDEFVSITVGMIETVAEKAEEARVTLRRRGREPHTTAGRAARNFIDRTRDRFDREENGGSKGHSYDQNSADEPRQKNTQSRDRGRRSSRSRRSSFSSVIFDVMDAAEQVQTMVTDTMDRFRERGEKARKSEASSESKTYEYNPEDDGPVVDAEVNGNETPTTEAQSDNATKQD